MNSFSPAFVLTISLAAVSLLSPLPIAWGATSTNTFFDAAQTMVVVSSNLTAVTINSGGYLFTYSQDGYFTGGVGLTNPVGRFFSVVWPGGIQAQSYTAGPLAGNGANISIKRADGKKFDLQSFTGKILLNTAGAGGAFEVTPQLNGNDASGAPFQYDCTGYSGMSFPYAPALTGYDTYQIHMWGDFALTALILTDTNPLAPPGPTNTINVSVSPLAGGSAGGAGDYASNSTCTVTASANPGWGFKNWTQNGAQVSASANYTFTVKSNRTLVANFVPAFTVTTSVSPAYGGTATGGGTFNSNSTVTVRATAVSGFQFVNWTDYGTPVSTATNYSFTITADHALTANFAPAPQTAVFDFDTASPALSQGQGLPGSQTKNGLTAYFSTRAGGWSMQSRQSSIVGAPPVFSGLFLYPSTWGSALQIQFGAMVTDVAFDFMTGEIAADYDIAGTVRLIAFSNSVPVATNFSQGAWLNGSYPEGHLAFHSATPFNMVRIDEAPLAVPSYLVFIDNIAAQQAAVQTFSINVNFAPTNAGFVSGAGSYANGATAMLTATPNLGFLFSGWMENGSVVDSFADYSFVVTSNRLLTAVFTTNTPPVANGGTFYQITNTPLVIHISDLMAFDYDPDGDVPFFTGTSATTAHGLPLTNDAVSVFVPANVTPDSFTYTIDDGHGGTATGSAQIVIITNPAGNPVALDMKSVPGTAVVNFSGIPWYSYTIQRGTNAAFSGNVQSWFAPAWADGSISLWDDFANLGTPPSQAFYRLRFP